jgi:hypothetical protein
MSHDRRPILSELADKAGVKSRVAEQIGPEFVVPTYSVIGDEAELDFEKYPLEFALKPTHGSQAGILVSEKYEKLEKQLLPIFHPWAKYYNIHPDDLRGNAGFIKIMSRCWLNSRYRQETEYCYKAIPPRIIIEKYIHMGEPDSLSDFRFYTFHGKVKFMRAASGYSNDLPTYAFDHNGIFLPIKAIHDEVEYDEVALPQLPKEWITMMALAEELSMGIDFIRVDFYLSQRQIYFSEMTNYPLAGNIKFVPESFDKLVSSYWKYFDNV